MQRRRPARASRAARAATAARGRRSGCGRASRAGAGAPAARRAPARPRARPRALSLVVNSQRGTVRVRGPSWRVSLYVSSLLVSLVITLHYITVVVVLTTVPRARRASAARYANAFRYDSCAVRRAAGAAPTSQDPAPQAQPRPLSLRPGRPAPRRPAPAEGKRQAHFAYGSTVYSDRQRSALEARGRADCRAYTPQPRTRALLIPPAPLSL